MSRLLASTAPHDERRHDSMTTEAPSSAMDSSCLDIVVSNGFYNGVSYFTFALGVTQVSARPSLDQPLHLYGARAMAARGSCRS